MNLKNAYIYDTDRKAFFAGGMTVKNGRITGFSTVYDAFDAEGMYLIPGLVDSHTHGIAGFDFDSATVEQMKTMEKAYAEAGTTTVVPTVASAPWGQMLHAVANIREAGFSAVHLEGRYLAPARRGAHKASLLRLPDPEELRTILTLAKPLTVRVTAAVEEDGGDEFIRTALLMGATVSIGHSDATYEEAVRAVSLGVTSFTHQYNAMKPFHHREPGCVGAGLLTDAYVELVCDGIHLHPATILLTRRVKAPEKIVLITDSMSGTDCPDGMYAIAGNPVEVRNGHAVTSDGAIAGSTLKLFDGLLNYAEYCRIPLEEAIPAATINPARSIGLETEVGSLAVGKKANALLLSSDRKKLCGVIKNGEFLYNPEKQVP